MKSMCECAACRNRGVSIYPSHTGFVNVLDAHGNTRYAVMVTAVEGEEPRISTWRRTVADPAQTFVTLHVPTAPRTTYSTSAPDPSHVEMRVSLAQLREWLKEPNDG